MEQSNEMLLQLLSEVLHEKPLSPISPEQWPAILQELRHQSIFALASGQVQQLSLSQQQITCGTKYALLLWRYGCPAQRRRMSAQSGDSRRYSKGQCSRSFLSTTGFTLYG